MRNGNFLKIRVKRIRANQGLGVHIDEISLAEILFKEISFEEIPAKRFLSKRFFSKKKSLK